MKVISTLHFQSTPMVERVALRKMKYANVEEQYKKDSALKKSDVTMLLEWCALQPHLPPVSELEAVLFLHTCYYSVQMAKDRIDTYYSCRTHCSELLANSNPRSKELQMIMGSAIVCVLPKRTFDDEIVIYTRFLDPNPEKFSSNGVIKLIFMNLSLHFFEHGCCKGFVIVMDCESAQLRHVMKTNLVSLKKAAYYMQGAMPIHFNAFHLVNAVSFMDKILALFKPIFKWEVREQLYVHYGTNETIFKFIPKECLPQECGGNGGSIAEIYASQRKRLEENADFFLEEDKKRVQESKRPGKAKNAGSLFGIEGSFKQLEID